jgi:hypothetical protein
MDVDLMIHYSDNPPCEIVAIRPVDGPRAAAAFRKKTKPLKLRPFSFA